MSYESAYQQLEEEGLADRVILFESSTATVALAAEQLGCEPDNIAKTMAFLAGEKPVMIVAAGLARIDNRLYKTRFGATAKMIHKEELESLTGHQPGGICPFGLKPGVEVWLDESLKAFGEIIYPACGTAQSAVRLTVSELERASRALGWVAVTKRPASETAAG